MRYAPRVRKISMFILFLESFLENDENVLSELCSSFFPESSYVDIGILCRKCAHTPPQQGDYCERRPARYGRQNCYRIASLFLAESRQDSCCNPGTYA